MTGVSSREARMQAIQAVPFPRINQSTAQALRNVLDNPSFYRRMPMQTIQCDPELYSFLVRKPEFMVNTWDLMGITKVTAKRTGPHSFLANDGVGTQCNCDLVYGADNVHIYYSVGHYDGSMTARTIKGRVVCILRSESQPYPQGHSGHIVRGTMDVFLKLDNLGADILTRTLGPLVAKTADHNFAETAQFVAQLSQVCANNPPAALGLASQLENIEEPIRQEFASIATRIAEDRHSAKKPSAAAGADPALMAQALQELKVATSTVPRLTSTPVLNEPLLVEQSSTVPPMDLRLLGSDQKSTSSRIRANPPAQMPLAWPDRTQASLGGIQPKKSGITMRR